VTRETIITPTGPIARATYQWDVRPAIAEVIPLDAIVIPWFDTVSRTLREAEIPARQIGGGLPDREDEAKPLVPASPVLVVGAALLAFGLGVALLGFGTGGAARPRLDARTRRALRRAAAARDGRAFRAALAPILQGETDLARAWRDQPAIAAGLNALDRSLYAPGTAETETPDLVDLARKLSRPVPVARSAAPESGRLAALDGPLR